MALSRGAVGLFFLRFVIVVFPDNNSLTFLLVKVVGECASKGKMIKALNLCNSALLDITCEASICTINSEDQDKIIRLFSIIKAIF